ncbi:hypothetical protein RN001_007692 [Aquatica leii]|uniref:5'-3' exoribonuclease 1 n=1 Tax=Aquatica leii TaxID=1421715 RepID=A0AAN7PDH4_9COLE|nr:hypothetical protein RN001_007692 [Aquatica leii]
MGVPKFFRYISERYPCLSEVIKEDQIPDFDNLYLDMNGIIHMCSHPDDGDAHFRITEEKIFTDIFHYIEVLFRMIKPRKLFFMAVDGVAPRAKMNQQRGRRFRSAKEAQTLEEKAIERGETLPNEARFDSNCITPGTVFMTRLHEQLKYFVVNKISNDKLWHNCKVILSGHETPGEGEHKIMDYIRYMRAQPGYDPNTRHCLYGLDADLIMLGLCTHEPHFSLLREEVRFGKKSNKRKNIPEQINFFLLHLSLMREYLELEFYSIKESLTFEYNMEKIIDDWVLMGFLVGNDFIPHLPNMHINNGALPVLYNAYMKVLPKLGGYINENGILNLERFETFIQELSGIDIDNFTEKYADLKWFEAKTGRRMYEKNGDVNSKLAEDDDFVTETVHTHGAENTDLANLIRATDDILLDPSLCAEDSDADNYSEASDSEDNLFQAEFVQHKTDYYMNKLEYANVTEEVLKSQAEEYVRAIQWNLHYYYNGVCSWSWFYPHHYAPYISDIKDFAHLTFNFDLAEPFKPYEQLLAVLPAASQSLLPEPYHKLMTDEESLIKQYYPEDFKTDLNGKKQEWEAVVLIPFIDEAILLKAMEPCNQLLTAEEKQRNTHGPMLVYEYTSENLNEYVAPEFFPSVTKSHAKCKQVFINEIRIPISKLIKGAYPGALFDVYYPGFPTMKHLKYTGHLQKAKVKVFEQPSRSDSMILSIVQEENQPTLDAIAKEILGKTVYVGWPHLQEALAISVSCCNYKYVNTGEAGQYNVEEIKGNLISVWDAERQAISEHYKNRMGVFVGATEVLVHVKVLTGQKYVFVQLGRITLEKQYSKFTSVYPLQTVVKNIPVHTESFTTYTNIEEVFPLGSHCFMLGQPCYGVLGEVMDSKETLKSGRVKICIKKYEEPDLSSVMQLDNSISVRFMNTHVAATKLAVSKKLFGRITGSVYLVPRKLFQMESDDVKKTNIGLNLKFNKKNEEIPGYTRKEGNIWYYSEKAIALVSAYMNEFPVVFGYLNFHVGKDVFIEDDIFPNEDAKEQIKQITTWIKKQPFYAIERQVCGSSMVDPEAIQLLEQVIDEFKKNTSEPKDRVMQVKPHLLYKNSLQMGNLMPDPTTTFKLYDRVVNVREGYTVPMGFKGTIIGIHKSGTQDDDIGTTFDVLFDNVFAGGLSINTSTNRGYRMPKPALINISHGIRALEQKSGKLGQLQNMQNQLSSRNNFNNTNGNATNAQSNMLNYSPSQYQPAQWAQGCNLFAKPFAGPPFPNVNQQSNYNQVPNFNAPFPNLPFSHYGSGSNYNQITSGPHSFVPYKNNHFPTNNPPIAPPQFLVNTRQSNLNLMDDIAKDQSMRREGDGKKEIIFNDSFIPTQVIKPSVRTKVPECTLLNEKRKQTENLLDDSPLTVQTKNMIKSDGGNVLTPEDIFAHARAKVQSPLAKNHVDDNSKKELYHTTQLSTEFQTRGLGIPNYEYFKLEDNFVARIKMPNGSEVIGDPASTRNEAAENAALETFKKILNKNEGKKILPAPQLPLNPVPPKPPKQWHSSQYQNQTSPQKTWRREKPQENWRAERHETVQSNACPIQVKNRVNTTLIHKHLNIESTSKTEDSKEVQKKKSNASANSASSFIPLQAVRQNRNRTSSTSTSEVLPRGNKKTTTETSFPKQETASAISKPVDNVSANEKITKHKPKRKVQIAANFQQAMSFK